MTKLQRRQWLHAGGMGALFACICFSFALATSESRGIGGPEVRGISTNFTRPPTTFVTDEELGWVVFGSQFTRQIIVRFGFKPHHFSFGTMPPPDGMYISDSGTISGVPTGRADGVVGLGVADFDVRVQDDTPTDVLPVAKNFRLYAVPPYTEPAMALQFVNASELPVAVANEPYSFTVQANGGWPPYVIQFATDADAQALPLGLSLNMLNGLIEGKPIMPSFDNVPSSFKLKVTDGLGSVVFRTFSLLVLPGTIGSDFVATAGSFKLTFGTEVRRDTFQLTMVLNKTALASEGVREASDLGGVDFSTNFGGVTLPPATSSDVASSASYYDLLSTVVAAPFDKNGRIRFPNMFAGKLPRPGEETKYEIKLNPRSGILTVKCANLDMIAVLGADFRSFGASRSAIALCRPDHSRERQDRHSGHDERLEDIDSETTTSTGSTPKAVNFDKTDVVKFSIRAGARSPRARRARTTNWRGREVPCDEVAGQGISGRLQYGARCS